MKARDPRRLPAATWFGLVGALLLAALALVLGQHAAAARGWTGADSWLSAAVAALDDPAPSALVLACGIAAALLGLWLLVAACLPARRSHARATGRSDLWIAPRAIEALAADAAERAPGVLHGSGEVRRRRLRVEALLSPGTEAGVAGIVDRVGDRLSGLADLEVSVQAKEASR
ncbi:DUF6286 domain-containing protein [Glycomyces paridis]|uniref:DUF6286 domain-containing protein n=1 Tax=Glycomyces paridis TaxID=2126555 RepID=A0A4V4HPQ3_9ACTN|nr:DUF6286 domain-containing protein [Glycomyces paridis]THV30856.1 hypothetical protein E9998_05635 [Glycomyces paridis]